MDYRRAHRAVELLNRGAEGFAELSEREDLTGILLEMGRAQSGDDDVTVEQMMQAARAGKEGD